MEWFDDLNLEEFSSQDFVEEIYEELFDNEDDSFQSYLNSNTDY
jgi:hypothetical protein